MQHPQEEKELHTGCLERPSSHTEAPFSLKPTLVSLLSNREAAAGSMDALMQEKHMIGQAGLCSFGSSRPACSGSRHSRTDPIC